MNFDSDFIRSLLEIFEYDILLFFILLKLSQVIEFTLFDVSICFCMFVF